MRPSSVSEAGQVVVAGLLLSSIGGGAAHDVDKVKRLLLAFVGWAVIGASLVACGDVEIDPPIKSCHPSQKADTKYGDFSARQRNPGGAIQYGAYPNISVAGDHYVMKVRAGGKIVDGFNQHYPPHGSVNRKTVAKHRGDVLSAIGTIHRNGKLTFHFELRCRIAQPMSPGALTSLTFLNRILSDFLGASESLSSLTFVDTSIGVSFPAAYEPVLGDEWPTDSLIVITPTRVSVISSSDQTEDEILVQVADVLVDRAMDDFGRPWPTGSPAGGPPLEPRLENGEAAWTVRGRRVCLIGELNQRIPSDG